MTPTEMILTGVGLVLCSVGAVSLIQFWVFGVRPEWAEDSQTTNAETNDQ